MGTLSAHQNSSQDLEVDVQDFSFEKGNIELGIFHILSFQLGVIKERNETESFTDIVVKVKFMF